MQYFTLGKTGLKVSQLALGTMTFGEEWGWGASEEQARALFERYLDAGGNFVDTADLYTNGSSETLLGKFIKETGTRDKVVLTTKYSYNADPGNPNAGGNGRKNVMRALEGSLQRLDTDYIDVYMLHTWDKVTPAEEIVRTFDDLVRSGKVRHVGISDAPAWLIAQIQTLASERGLEPLATAQMEYSLVERNIEHEFVPLVTTLGTGIMAWSPLASGLLSGKYRPSQGALSNGEVEGEGRLAQLADSGNPAFAKFNDKNFAIVAALEEVANELDRSMAQVAINWVANRPGVASVLIGATKMSQLEDNLGSLDFNIPSELQQKLDEVSAPYTPNPYTFFTPAIQGMIHGGASVGDKPDRYFSPVRIAGGGAGVE